MCAYNRINGVYAAENKEALTDILRGEWNFHGYVVSDWGAVNDRVADLEAGMDLEMPSSCGMRDAEIVKAVRCGRLPESASHASCASSSAIWTADGRALCSTGTQTTNWHGRSHPSAWCC